MKNFWNEWKWLPILVVGCIVFSLGFNVFLAPHDINCGGVSGLAQVLVEWTGIGTVGIWTAAMNVPLFILGGKKIGKKFFFGSLVGMISMSVSLDLFANIPMFHTDILLGALYGGVVTGVGMGMVFMSGVSSGGTDIVVRLVKLRKPNSSIGSISLTVDFMVAILTGIVFHDFTKTLYGGVVLFVSTRVIDAVIYSFDYSKVALIISNKNDEIASMIDHKLQRGVTYLNGQGYYHKNDTKVILSAIKKQQVSDLKAMASEIDPDAFIIIQEAHQVLGVGFHRYSKDDL